MAMELDVAIKPSEKAVENPDSIIVGTRTAPRAATVAGPEPEIAPKKQATITQTMAIPPYKCPTQSSIKLTRRVEIPAFAIIFPESTKKGMASSRNFAVPV